MGRSTKIELFSNLSFPLDNSHVRRFASLSAQTAYFDSLPKTTLENFVYTRVDNYDFTFNVTGKIQGSQQWGYMRLKNLFDGNRWYYCFITKVEYVDDSTVKVYGSLDFYQTYVYDMTILESFVERQHEPLYQSNGLPVLNTIDEGLNYGLEYQTVYNKSLKVGNLYYLVIVSTKKIGNTESRETINFVGTPTPVYFYIIPYFYSSDYAYINITYDGRTYRTPRLEEIMEELKGSEEIVNSIVSLYITTQCGIDIEQYLSDDTLNIPTNDKFDCVAKVINNNPLYLISPYNIKAFQRTNINIPNKYELVPNYKESKLKMFPYTVIYISDMKGNQLEIKPEFLKGSNCSIMVTGSLGTQNKVSYYPSNYKTFLNEAKEHVLIDESPNNIPILTDATADYIQGNQNSINTKLSLADSNRWVDVGSSVVNAIPLMMLPQTAPLGIAQATTGIANAENRRYNEVKTLQAKQADINNLPPNAKNMGGNTSYEWGNGFESPQLFIKTVTNEYAKKLSDFFHMYGYQINELRIPNPHTRSHFNYVKCQSLNVRSGMNREIILRFKSIFENGVTLWHTNDLQNYNVSNEVI